MSERRSRKGRDPVLIGFAERVDLPDWGINRIRAKVDTGARTSALHVDGITRLPDGKVRFDVVVNRRTGRTKHVVTDVSRVGQVRSSSGASETRYFVRTTLKLGDVEKEIEISLARRHAMQFRMLLGRTGLGHDFIIDAARRYVTDHHPHPSHLVRGGSRDEGTDGQSPGTSKKRTKKTTKMKSGTKAARKGALTGAKGAKRKARTGGRKKAEGRSP